MWNSLYNYLFGNKTDSIIETISLPSIETISLPSIETISLPSIETISLPPTDRERVIKALDLLGLPSLILIDYLTKYHAVMAGSFPLQVYLNEKYDDSDVDIFVNDLEPNLDEFHIYLASLGILKSHLYVIAETICSYKYTLSNGTQLNLIRINTPDLKTYINTYFDLSCCQTIFDGTNLSTNSPLTDHKVAYVSYFSPETQRTPPIEYQSQMVAYQITHPDSPCKEIQSRNPIQYLLRRIKKYEDRGFRIIHQGRPTEALTSSQANQIWTQREHLGIYDPTSTKPAKCIIDKLDKLGVNGQHWIDTIIKTKSLMYGIFPLQCILGENAESYEILILTQDDLKYNYDHNHPMLLDELTNYYPKVLNIAYEETYSINHDHNYWRYQINSNVFLNIIPTNMAFVDFIQQQIEYSLGQVTFNGQFLNCPYPELTLNKIGYQINPYSERFAQLDSNICFNQLNLDDFTIIENHENPNILTLPQAIQILCEQTHLHYIRSHQWMVDQCQVNSLQILKTVTYIPINFSSSAKYLITPIMNMADYGLGYPDKKTQTYQPSILLKFDQCNTEFFNQCEKYDQFVCNYIYSNQHHILQRPKNRPYSIEVIQMKYNSTIKQRINFITGEINRNLVPLFKTYLDVNGTSVLTKIFDSNNNQIENLSLKVNDPNSISHYIKSNTKMSLILSAKLWVYKTNNFGTRFKIEQIRLHDD